MIKRQNLNSKLQKSEGIWIHPQISENIELEYRLTLKEGNTPFEVIEYKAQKIFLKREDQNPNQSFKDRSIAYQLSHYYQKGYKNFVISSSGNAAVSAIAYARLAKLNLKVFLSTKTPEYKKIQNRIPELENFKNVSIHESLKPKSDAIKFAIKHKFVNLRGSTDNQAITGYLSLGYEIQADLPDADAIFICCSSGTSTIGIFNAYTGLIPNSKFDIPHLNIVQTTKIHPIAQEFDKDFEPSTSSLANAVCDNVAHRKSQLLDIIKNTNGNGWVVSDADLEEAKEVLTSKGIKLPGYNAYVSFAGYLKAQKKGYKFQKPVCIISGI
jgi:threonine synthase